MRLFVAANLAEDLRRPLAEAQRALAASGADVKWTHPAGWHLTLKFLGEVPEPQLATLVATIRQAVAEAGVGPFRLALRGIGGFPSARAPRVVWAGVVAGQEPLAALAASLERALEPLGFAPEGRPFSAHLTLGRVRSPAGREALAAKMQILAEQDFGEMQVTQVHLMQSRLSPRGATYNPVEAFPLAG